jgi:hypothetical protein
MNPRPFAYIAGAILLILGIAGFIPPLAPAEDDALRIAAKVGGAQLFGLFPVSPVLSALHVTLGAWGLWAALVFAVLLVMGTIPGADTLFGLAPLYGNNLLLHGLLAVLCFLFGWLYRRPAGPADGEDAAEA